MIDDSDLQEEDTLIQSDWWVAAISDHLVWARLDVFRSGKARVFDSSGEYPRYDDEQNARAALLDAEFRAFDGLDDEDAALLGFDLESIEPPHAGDDEDLLPMMVQKLARLQ
jgi:hypothetical protein